MNVRKAVGLVVVALVGSACGGGGAKPKDATSAKSADWYSKLVDDQNDTEIRMRPNDFAADAFAGPLVDTAKKEASAKVDDPAAAAMIKVIEKSDILVVAVHKITPVDAVIIVGGVPSGTSPDGLTDASGAPVWKKAESSGGGDEWQVASGSPEEQEGRLAIVGGNTWIFATGPAVPRMNEAIAGGATSGYAPDAAGGGKGLFDLVLAGEGLENLKNDPNAGFPPPVMANLKHASVAFDGGSSPGVHATLTYADEPSAGQVDQLLNAMAAKTPALKMIGDLKIAHSGSDLTADLPVSPAVRDLVIASAGAGAGAGEGGGDDAAVQPPTADSRPQEIKPKKKKKKGH